MVEDGRHVVPGYPAIETKQKLCHVCSKDERNAESSVFLWGEIPKSYGVEGCEQRDRGQLRGVEGEPVLRRKREVVWARMGGGDEEKVVRIVSSLWFW